MYALLITQAVLLFVIGMFLFFAVMDVCGAVERAWSKAMTIHSHRHDYWACDGNGVPVLVHNNEVTRC